MGWSVPVGGGHNGYVDIFLNLGYVGLILFLIVLGLMVYRAVKFALNGSAITEYLPAFILLFAILANITEGFFMEIEMLFWMLLVWDLFQTTPINVMPQNLESSLR